MKAKPMVFTDEGRDPKRINRIIKKIETVWNRYPDMRFCQIMENWLVQCHRDGCDYYTEDNIFEARIDKLLEEIKNEKTN